MTTEAQLEQMVGLRIDDIEVPEGVQVRDTGMIYTAQWFNELCLWTTDGIIVRVGRV